MRVFTVPKTHADELEVLIARICGELNQDAWRRENGHKPLLDDAYLEPKAKGHVFVVVGEFNDRLPLAVGLARGKVATNVPRSRSRKRA